MHELTEAQRATGSAEPRRRAGASGSRARDQRIHETRVAMLNISIRDVKHLAMRAANASPTQHGRFQVDAAEQRVATAGPCSSERARASAERARPMHSIS